MKNVISIFLFFFFAGTANAQYFISSAAHDFINSSGFYFVYDTNYPPIRIIANDTTAEFKIIDCSGGPIGVTVDADLTGTKLYHLTIYDCTTGISLSSNAVVKNVLFEECTTDIGGVGTPTVSNNYASEDGDPLLIDPVNNNFGLQSNSPAKDAGAVLYTYAAHPGDYYGRKIYGDGPDIGAVEYEDHTPGGWFFEMFMPLVMKLCASTNAACYTQP